MQAATADPVAPPADAFLQLRTRLGVRSGDLNPAPSWLARGYLQALEGRLELASRGLDFADSLALDCD